MYLVPSKWDLSEDFLTYLLIALERKVFKTFSCTLRLALKINMSEKKFKSKVLLAIKIVFCWKELKYLM